MLSSIVITLFFFAVLLFLSCLVLRIHIDALFYHKLFPLLFLAFFLRVILAGAFAGHPTDMACFRAWADMLWNDGLSNFYISEAFTDYPPGYMLVLYFIGGLRHLFGLGVGGAGDLIVKMPGMVADCLTGVFIYKIASKSAGMNHRRSSGVFLMYLLNPAIIFISTAWGQVDSIHTLLLVASIYFLLEEKISLASVLFVIAVGVKPQSLILSPIYIYVFWSYLYKNKFAWPAWRRLLIDFGCCVLVAFFIMLPFATASGRFVTIRPVLEQFGRTLSSYPYATVNAYNLYAMMGLNWKPIETEFLGLTIGTWGTVFIVLITLSALLFLWKRGSKANVYYAAGFLSLGTFLFSAKMHERYVFPALIMLLVAYIYSRRKAVLAMFFSASGLFFLNCFEVYRQEVDQETNINYWQKMANEYTARIVGGVFVALGIWVIIYAIIKMKEKKEDGEERIAGYFENPEPEPVFTSVQTRPDPKMDKRDYALMFAVTIIYGIFAFSGLGDMNAAQTRWDGVNGREYIIQFDRPTEISEFQFYPGPKEERDFELSFSYDLTEWDNTIAINSDSVFHWHSNKAMAGQAATPYRYAKIVPKTAGVMLMEVAFRDQNGQIVPIVNSRVPDIEALVDEQQFVPIESNYKNSTYFDEIYHARTAYELIHKMPVYEWTHPPLGKEIIGLGIKLFGMTPFGWRFSGTLCGVLMLPLLYLFAKKMFKESGWAFLATLLFAADFMHYAQTRIATIDSYITFFVILMFFFMYQFYRCDFYAQFKKSLCWLGLCGLSMGLGMACKWPGMYAGLGLAVIFFMTLWRRYKEYRATNDARVRSSFKRQTIITLALCLLFFVAVPAVIYLLAYKNYYAGGSLYPLRKNIGLLKDNALIAGILGDNSLGNYIAAVAQNQLDMFNYHSKLVSSHPYASPWWMWIFDIRPIYYYAHTAANGYKAGISSFGNPLVWLPGLASAIAAAVVWAKRRSTTAAFLIVAALAQLLPWFVVMRTTYIYHYFPSVPFLCLFIVFALRELTQVTKLKWKSVYWIYAGWVVLLFLLYLPVLTGTPSPIAYLQLLRGFIESWQLFS